MFLIPKFSSVFIFFQFFQIRFIFFKEITDTLIILFFCSNVLPFAFILFLILPLVELGMWVFLSFNHNTFRASKLSFFTLWYSCPNFLKNSFYFLVGGRGGEKVILI